MSCSGARPANAAKPSCRSTDSHSGHGVRYHELGGLHRIVGVEIVISLHIAGQIDDLRDGLLCWCGVAGRQGRQRVGTYAATSTARCGALGDLPPCRRRPWPARRRSSRHPRRRPGLVAPSSASPSADPAGAVRPRCARGAERSRASRRSTRSCGGARRRAVPSRRRTRHGSSGSPTWHPIVGLDGRLPQGQAGSRHPPPSCFGYGACRASPSHPLGSRSPRQGPHSPPSGVRPGGAALAWLVIRQAECRYR